MNLRERVQGYLSSARMMQIATVRDDQPWIATVYGIEDDHLNLYWLSFPNRRHSTELGRNKKAAIAVPIKADLPVIGLQAEGTVSVVDDSVVVKSIMERSVERYGVGGRFYDRFTAGRNQHVMYKFSPTRYVLFDEQNFPNDPQKELLV